MRPLAILSLILDGMDQNKTDLPHYSLWNVPSVSTHKMKYNALSQLNKSGQEIIKPRIIRNIKLTEASTKI